MPRTQTPEEAQEFIVDLLRQAGRPLRTREIEERNQDRGTKCPDSAVLFLKKLQMKGVIKGEVSVELGGWVWWVD